jgi:hypothetical protein
VFDLENDTPFEWLTVGLLAKHAVKGLAKGHVGDVAKDPRKHPRTAS